LTPTIAYVGLGSNLMHPRRQIARAARRLAHIPGTRLIAVSPNYVSEPIGSSSPQPDYINAVAMLSTSLSPRALLARLLAIERRHGRRRPRDAKPNAPRPLDLDLLLYGRIRMQSSSLILPHPRMHERAFVLRPLIDVAPARYFLRTVRSQRAAPTPRHVA